MAQGLAAPPAALTLVPLAAVDVDGLRRRIGRAIDSATALADDALLPPVAARQPAGRFRAVVVAAEPRGLETELARIATWLEEPDAAAAPRVERGAILARADARPRVGVLFPGQGAPVHTGAGALGELVPDASAVHSASGLDALDGEVPPSEVQLAIVASCLSALKAVLAVGIQPDFALGHSLGELLALHWSGVFGAPELLQLTRARGEAMTGCTTPGAMATVIANGDAFSELVEGRPVQLACENSPTQRVISGEPDAVAECVTSARERGLRASRLPVNGAFHSRLMEPALPRFRRALAATPMREPRQPVISTVSGTWISPGADLGQLLAEQLTSPVRFLEAARAGAGHADVMIEVGPGRALTGLVGECTGLPCVAMEAGSPSPIGALRWLGFAWACGAATTLPVGGATA